MEDQTFKAIVISNTILMSIFIAQKMIEYIFHSFQKKKEKEESTIERLVKEVSTMNAEIAALKAQVKITLVHIFKINEVEKGLENLADKIRPLL